MSEAKQAPVNEVVESVENAARYSDGLVLLKNVRASYPHVLKAAKFKGAGPDDPGSYSIKVLLSKTTHDEARKLLQRSEEHTSELQSRPHLVCRLLLEKKNKN